LKKNRGGALKSRGGEGLFIENRGAQRSVNNRKGASDSWDVFGGGRGVIGEGAAVLKRSSKNTAKKNQENFHRATGNERGSRKS